MGVLVVHCPNRPKDEIIDCGVYGLHLNMHTHNVDAINGEVLVGVPLESGKKLPSVDEKDEENNEKIEEARALSIGAVIGRETSGILSTDLPGGVVVEETKPEPDEKSAEKPKTGTKSAQAKEGGE